MWYLHNVESPNNNNNINISLLKEESLSKMESSLEITFPTLRKYNKNEANGQYIINVVLQVDGQHNNNNNGVGYVHAVGNNTNNSLNGANSSSNHMDSIVFMVKATIYCLAAIIMFEFEFRIDVFICSMTFF